MCPETPAEIFLYFFFHFLHQDWLLIPFWGANLHKECSLDPCMLHEWTPMVHLGWELVADVQLPCTEVISPALVTSLSPGILRLCCSRKGRDESLGALGELGSHHYPQGAPGAHMAFWSQPSCRCSVCMKPTNILAQELIKALLWPIFPYTTLGPQPITGCSPRLRTCWLHDCPPTM